MKGQNPLLSHVFVTAFLVALVLSVIIITTTLKTRYETFIGEHEVDQVCSIIKSSIAKLRSDDSYVSLNDTIKGRIYLNLPAKIANSNYNIRFIGRNATITGTANVTCAIGFNATYTGTSSGGRSKLEWKELKTAGSVVELGNV